MIVAMKQHSLVRHNLPVEAYIEQGYIFCISSADTVTFNLNFELSKIPRVQQDSEKFLLRVKKNSQTFAAHGKNLLTQMVTAYLHR